MKTEMYVNSHKGRYQVQFNEDGINDLNRSDSKNRHFIIDRQVASLYSGKIRDLLSSKNVYLIDATESAKTLDVFTSYVENFVKNQIRRGDSLIAIGGGITQDITCFLAATLLRGLEWEFYPTTLLAQADSCIGSKSSINVGETKNILGTYTPPRRIVIDPNFLTTLTRQDIRSGVGEMIKVHVIDGQDSFSKIAKDYDSIFEDQNITIRYIQRSLEIKRRIIEVDEFDQGIRNVMNYGHSFGHAIESATNFLVPHGIAVTIGMDMANFTSMKMGRLDEPAFLRMHSLLKRNFCNFEDTVVPMNSFLNAIAKDKKNIGSDLRLILINANGNVEPCSVPNDAQFQDICAEYFESRRLA